MAYTIRPMTEGDAELLAAVQRRCPGAAQWEVTAGPGIVAMVAEEGDGEVTAFAVWQELPGNEAELLNLAVAPARRRRGAARALLDAMGARRIWLEVRASNGGAIAFYRRVGFAECGRRRDYYRDPADDAVLMMREPVTAQGLGDQRAPAGRHPA